jgi:hypothetical protein
MQSGPSTIQAFLRVRPVLARELAEPLPWTLVHDPGQGTNFVRVARSLPSAGGEVPREVALDRVLPASASQEEVYMECVAPLVADCVAGRDVALVAYGGTVGAGVCASSCSRQTLATCKPPLG